MTLGRIFSIGHGGQSADTLIKQLNRAEILYVIDVRSTPYSRFQPEFSRDPLNSLLQENSLKYVFMGDLLGGRPKDDDCYTEGKVDYSKVKTKNFFMSGISRLKNARSKGFNICLICSESHPSQCHRAKLVGEALSTESIDVTHILPDGAHQSQRNVILEITDGQLGLFGDNFTSKKSYR